MSCDQCTEPNWVNADGMARRAPRRVDAPTDR